MAFVDVVKCTMGMRELVAKFPSDDLRLGTQLVVYPGQTAFFVKGGRIYDMFESGTYTLSTSNIPLLNKLINLPFGGRSPFKAEVWYINRVALLDSKWGTTTPLQIEDPIYEVLIPVRAYGQYGFRIGDPRTFLETIVGNMTSFFADDIDRFFKGKILSHLTNIISDKLTKDKISILKINSYLFEISEYCKERISHYLEKYGIALEEFDAISINVKEDDPSYIKLKEAKDLAARIKITGKDVYQMDRSFDVLDSAALNPGIGGEMMSAGVGLGVGMNVANRMGQVSSVINTNPVSQVPPPIQQSVQYYLAINGQQNGPYSYDTISTSIRNGNVTGDMLVWKVGMANWDKIKNVSEFSSLFCTPPPIPPQVPPIP